MGDGWGERHFAGSCCCPKACKASRRKSRTRGRLCRKLKALADRLFLLNCQGWEAIVDERREVPFPTFPTCSWLHKAPSTEPEVAMPTCTVPPIHLPDWTMPWAWRRGSPSWNKTNLQQGSAPSLEDSESCVSPWPLCHWWETAPEKRLCSTSASMSRVLYLCCWIWFQVLIDRTESVLLPSKGITNSGWVCVPAFLSVALEWSAFQRHQEGGIAVFRGLHKLSSRAKVEKLELLRLFPYPFPSKGH